MNAKPMLRRGHYIVQQSDGAYFYSRLGVKENGDGSLTITKGPHAISDREGYIVVSSKIVYKVNRDDFFRSTLSADRLLAVGEIKQTFAKPTTGQLDVKIVDGTSATEAGRDHLSAEFEDDLRQADDLIKDQIEVLRC